MVTCQASIFRTECADPLLLMELPKAAPIRQACQLYRTDSAAIFRLVPGINLCHTYSPGAISALGDTCSVRHACHDVTLEQMKLVKYIYVSDIRFMELSKLGYSV